MVDATPSDAWLRSCPRCLAAGKRSPGFASDRECAFKGAAFDTRNWQCESIAALVEGVDDSDMIWHEDQSLLTLPFVNDIAAASPGDFMVLGRYKHRGRLELALVIEGTQVRPLMLSDIDYHLTSKATRAQAVNRTR